MEYDGILKWDEDGKGCSTCFLQEPEACTNEIKCGYPYGHKAYMNIVQLACLIEEAEAGYPDNAETGYRGYEGFWICEASNECTEKACSGQRPHKKKHACGKGCFKSDIDAVCIPYRGTKGEDQKFNGVDKRVIESLIEECDEEAGPTAEDCSEVVPSGNGVTDDTEAIRSIQESKYNKDREFLRGEAGEVINSGGIKIIIDDDLTPLSDIKVKAEVQEDDVEYVVANSICIPSLVLSEMDRDSIRAFINVHGSEEWNKKATWFHHTAHDEFTSELIRCRFIERKVDDYPANAGDYFSYKNTVWAVLPINGYLHLLGIKGAMLGEQTGLAILPNGNRMLSDHVRKDCLPEFKKVNVEIREVD